MAIEASRRRAGEADLLTPRGVVLFRSGCPDDMIRELKIDAGIGQLTRFNHTIERERLIDTARRPDGCVTLAYTQDAVIVGYVVVAQPDPRDRWGNVKGVYEMLAIDVSKHWRGRGIGRKLLRQAFAAPVWGERIVFATAYAWHWDLAGTGLTKAAYAKMLANLVRPAGFLPRETDEPNIRWDEANMLLVRIGSNVDDAHYYSFQARLFEYRF